MQCGTILAASAEPIAVHPPRMSGWKKPFRSFFRLFRLAGFKAPHIPSLPGWFGKIAGSSLFGSVFSVIPGLPQFIRGQFRSIRGYWIAWATTLCGAVFFWGTPASALLFGIALSLHVWMAMQAGILDEIPELSRRIAIFLFLAVIYSLLYYHGSYWGLRALGIRGGYSLFSVPSLNIETGHYFWGRTRHFTLERGDIVLTNLRTVGNHGNLYNRSTEGFVRIVGLPKETLTLKDGLFQINEQTLDKELFPVPDWLMRIKNYNLTLGENQYFIVAEFRGQGYNSSQISSVCVISSGEIRAEAFITEPLWRNRAFIGNNP
jgi:hypothetical protein